MKSSKYDIAGGCSVCTGSKHDSCKSISVLIEKLFISDQVFSNGYAAEILTKTNTWREGKGLVDVTQIGSINENIYGFVCHDLPKELGSGGM